MKPTKTFLEVYAPKPKDERNFVDKHVIVTHKDRNEVNGKANEDDVFKATNVKTVERKKTRLGHNPGDDARVYEDVSVEELLDQAIGIIESSRSKKVDEAVDSETQKGWDDHIAKKGMDKDDNGPQAKKKFPKFARLISKRKAAELANEQVEQIEEQTFKSKTEWHTSIKSKHPGATIENEDGTYTARKGGSVVGAFKFNKGMNNVSGSGHIKESTDLDEGSRSLSSASNKFQASIEKSIRKAAREYNRHGDAGIDNILRNNDLNAKHIDKIKAHAASISRKKVTEDVELEEGTMRLSNVHIVHHHDHPAAKEFAKAYTSAMKGEHRPGGPTDADVQASEDFHMKYGSQHTHNGFAGSGTTIYHDRKTKARWKVDRHPNGKTFYGTDHIISHDTGSIHEEVECIDEMKTTPSAKLRALVAVGDRDPDGMSRAFGMQIKAARAELQRRKKAGIKEDLDEGYKVGDMVNVTNPKATARYKILGKTKTHYHLEKPNGDTMHMPKERIARVNKQAWSHRKAKAQNEEVEVIDELSKKTLGNYIKKANVKGNEDARTSTYYDRWKGDKDPDIRNTGHRETDKAERSIANRRKGIRRAVNKLTKEDVIDLAIEKYVPEQYTFTPTERLLKRLEGISESHVDTILNLFNTLNEHNQQVMIEQAQTREGINKLIDFAINSGDL